VNASAGIAPTAPDSRPLRFPKDARLKRRVLIRALFDRRSGASRSVAAGCVRLVFRIVPRVAEDVPVQAGFSPGRLRTAVARNRVKRILREVYRTHQVLLVDLSLLSQATLTLMVLYRGRPEEAAGCVPRDLPRALDRLAAALQDAPEESSMSPEPPQ
jgi:ribonuclease P protein component